MKPRYPLIILFHTLAVTLLLTGLVHASSVSIPPTQKPYIINRIKYYPISSSAGYIETGTASWYGPDFHGKKTSNGERYDMYKPTAAHKILPMNTMLHVKNLENGKDAVVRVNDRGPFVRGRIIDLSFATAKRLEVVRKGTAKVRITALAPSYNGQLEQPFDFNKGEFYVQIGSFKIKENAIRLRNRFTQSGHPCVIRQFQKSSVTFYRVQVYAGEYLKHAKRAEAALLERGYRGAFIIAR